MNLRPDLSPIDGTLHAENIVLLQAALASTDLAGLSARSPGIFAPSDVYSMVPSSALLPKTTVVVSADQKKMIIILNGMIGFDKVAACLTGWGQPQPSVNGRVYPYEEAAYTLIPYTFRPALGQVWDEVRVIGHSYGGAVGQYLGGMLAGIGVRTMLGIYTYGAPKPGLSASWRRDITVNTRRVFILADPVPILPLRSDDLATLWTVCGVPTARLWSQWRQPISGLAIYPTGYFISADQGAFRNSFGPVSSVANWLAGPDAFGSDNHSLAAYAAAIAPIPAVNSPNQYPATHTVPNTSHTPTTRQLVLQQSVALTNAGQTANADPAAAVSSIVRGVTLVPGERFRGAFWGGVNAVWYNGQPVQLVATRRLRRALVRKLNALLIDQ